MAEKPVPIPLGDPIERPKRDRFAKEDDPLAGKLSEAWEQYFQNIESRLASAALLVNTASGTAQSASVGSTDFSGGGVSVGLYMISYYARITTAAGTSSSLQLTFTWTDHGAAPSVSTTAYTGNSTVAPVVGSFLIYTDAGAPINYVVTRGSVGAPAMIYEYYVTLQKVAA